MKEKIDKIKDKKNREALALRDNLKRRKKTAPNTAIINGIKKNE